VFVRVTPEAAVRIRRRGGRLFLWQQPVGRAFVREQLQFDRVLGPWEFVCVGVEGVEVCLAGGMPGAEVRVEASRWPRGGVRVYVDGKRWGRRGDSADIPAALG
jgi:hypothetical protein